MNTNTTAARRFPKSRLAVAGVALAAALTLAGCTSAPADTNAANTGSSASAESGFTLAEGWAKASDGDMTGVFGTLTNAGDEELVLTKVESSAAGMIELHETVTSGSTATMREIDGGFVIPAGGSLELVPGGNHIMFMDLAKPLLAGDEVELTLTFADDSTVETSVLVKDYDGAQENYGDIESEEMDHGSMDMEEMDHGDTSGDEHAG